MTSPRVPTLFSLWKAKRTGAQARAPRRPGVVADLGMCGRSLRGNREISRLVNREVSRSALARIGKARSNTVPASAKDAMRRTEAASLFLHSPSSHR